MLVSTDYAVRIAKNKTGSPKIMHVNVLIEQFKIQNGRTIDILDYLCHIFTVPFEFICFEWPPEMVSAIYATLCNTKKLFHDRPKNLFCDKYSSLDITWNLKVEFAIFNLVNYETYNKFRRNQVYRYGSSQFLKC